MLKKIRYICLLPILFMGFFAKSYFSLPSTISLTEGGNYTLELEPFLNISSKTVPTSASGEAFVTQTAEGLELNTASTGHYTLGIKMFGFLPLKELEVNVAPEYSVIPSGEPVGIKIFSDGLLVINISEVKTASGTVSPARDAGLAVGDRIISVGLASPSTSEELALLVNGSEGDISLKVLRGEDIIDISIAPALSSDDGSRRLGIWVRDSTAGVGTMTFYDPKSSSFATLGHAITDVDTGDIITPRQGTLCDCDIISVKKGVSGTPGELAGRFGEDTLGDILLNSSLGVYGRLTDPEKLASSDYMKVATRFEVKAGEAYIIADVDGGGARKYTVNIEDVSKSERTDNKSMVISVTDPDLLEKTGGIVQGMSGAPIIQNNMLVGALTHVFVNDPTKGYGIFAENMLDTALDLHF